MILLCFVSVSFINKQNITVMKSSPLQISASDNSVDNTVLIVTNFNQSISFIKV